MLAAFHGRLSRWFAAVVLRVRQVLRRFLTRFGLRGEVIALYVVSTVVIFSTTAYVYSFMLIDAINHEYRERGLTVWRAIDATYPSPEDLRGPLIQQRIERLTQSNPDFAAVRLYAPVEDRFLVVASSQPALIGQAAGLDDLQPMLQDREVWREYRQQGQAVAEVAAPLHTNGRPHGVLTIRFDLSARDATVQQQILAFLVIGGLGGVCLLAALYWELDRLMIKPLRLLRQQAAAITDGDLAARSNMDRDDEVGILAADFDQMVEVLEQREQENRVLQGELQSRYEEAELRAVRDPITGLYNHGHFYERLAHEIARTRRNAQNIAILFCDLDHFKAVNDTYGHQAGDQVLNFLAGLLKRNCREMDIPARYGGEEFTVILPDTGTADAQVVAERIRAQLGASSIAIAPNTAITVTLSIGIACFPKDAASDTELVRCADAAMYHAKRLGRNQVRTYAEAREMFDTDGSLPIWGGESFFWETVQSLAAAVDARDRYTHSHSNSVAQYATAIARAMAFPSPMLTQIWIAGLLHDVGKIGIPDQVLGKAGALTDEEWQKMRTHPEVGRSIIQHIRAYEQVVPLILHHHEHFNGEGYPYGLAGEAIPLGARIIAVADAYHAMTSDRPYRKAFARSYALSVLERESGTQFDPDIVKVFLQIPEEVLLGVSQPVELQGEAK